MVVKAVNERTNESLFEALEKRVSDPEKPEMKEETIKEIKELINMNYI